MNKLKSILTLALIALAFTSQAQPLNYVWGKTMAMDGSGGPYSTKIDDDRNVYIGGSFQNTVDFDPGVGVAEFTADGVSNIFVQKLDPDGNYLWAVSFGGSFLDAARSIDVDASGNVYVTGEFRETVDFDPGPGIENRTAEDKADIFILKLDAAGNLVWVVTPTGPGENYGKSIVLDYSGNLIVTGQFDEGLDFNADPNETHFRTTVGGGDIFVMKLDTDGNFLWANTMGSGAYDAAGYISVDGADNILVTGTFVNTIDFQPNSSPILLEAVDGNDFFVLKLSPDGDVVWTRQVGGDGSDFAGHVATDLHANVYVAGHFAGTCDFNPGAAVWPAVSNGGFDGYVVQLDVDGNFNWVKTFGSADDDGAFGIVRSSDFSMYILGSFHGTVDLEPGFDELLLTSAGAAEGNPNLFVQKIDMEGDNIWVQAYGGTDGASGWSIDAIGWGDVVIASRIEGPVNFNPEGETTLLGEAGVSSMGVVKINSPLVGLSEGSPSDQIDLDLYPNPTTGNVTIDLTEIEGVNQISLIDMMGRLVYSHSYNGAQSIVLPVSELSSGIYLVRVQGNDHQFVSRLVRK